MGVEAGGYWRLLVGRSLNAVSCGHREVSTEEGSEVWVLLTLKMRPGLHPRTRSPLGPRKGRNRLRASKRDQPCTHLGFNQGDQVCLLTSRTVR